MAADNCDVYFIPFMCSLFYALLIFLVIVVYGVLNFEDIRLSFTKKKRAAKGATIDSRVTEATVADESKSKMADPQPKTPKTTSSSKITSINDRDVKTIKNTTPTESTANPTADNQDLNTVKSTVPTETKEGTDYQAAKSKM